MFQMLSNISTRSWSNSTRFYNVDGKIMAENIEEIVIRIICDQLDLDSKEVRTSNFLMDDLGADPYDLEELGNLLSDEFEIEITEDEIESWESVMDVILLASEKLVE